MNEQANERSPDDPRQRALASEQIGSLRSKELREADAHEALDRQRSLWDGEVGRRVRQADLIERSETYRSHSLRERRTSLESQVDAAHEVAGRAFGELGRQYVAGESKVDDLLSVEPLPEAEAARRAKVLVACAFDDSFLRVLKYAAMLGCLLLGTFGMGALVLRVVPRALLHSPLLPVAVGLGCILVGGATLAVSPSARRLGAMTVDDPDGPRTKRNLQSVCALTLVFTLVVATVDAKALLAITASKALVDPKSAPSFATAFLVALALSATYVVGSSAHAFAEGFGFEARKRIAAEQEKHAQSERDRLRHTLEVTQACEALNAVDTIEARRIALDDEIRNAEGAMRGSVAQAFEGIGAPPEMARERRNELRYAEQEARFAGMKLAAHEASRQTPREEG
jgi:hypothetical protein